MNTLDLARKTSTALVAVVLASVPVAIAQAQESSSNALQIEEIIVTAQKREAAVQDVPMAITALTEEAMTLAGINSMQDLGSAVAGLEVVNSQPGRNRLIIRGIGDQSSSLQSTATAGYYVDETPLTSNPGSMAELAMFDVERIEVLRGPQGTLFGDGSMGGTVRVITSKPDASGFSGKFQATGSDTDGGGTNYAAKGMVNIPVLEDKFAIRATASYSDLEGWLNNSWTGETKTNSSNATDARIGARLTPNDALTIDLTHYVHRLELDDSYSSDENYIKDTSLREPQNTEIDLTALTIQYDFENSTFTSATGYWDQQIDFLVDRTTLGLQDIGTLSDSFATDMSVFTQEFRLASANEGKLQWTVGAFFKKEERELKQLTDLHDFFGFIFGVPDEVVNINDVYLAFDIDSYAVFADFTYSIRDNLRLNAGARYFEDERQYDLALVIFGEPLPIPVDPTKVSDDAISPRVSLNWDINDSVMAFATASKGFRSGGINDAAVEINAFAIEPCAVPPGPNCLPGPVGGEYREVSGDAVSLSYSAEDLWNYEIGIKSMLRDNTVMLNAYLYYQDYKDLQTSVAQPVFEPGFIGNLGYRANVGSASSTGAEVELRALVSEQFEIGLNATYIDAILEENVGSGSRPLVDDDLGSIGVIEFRDETFATKGNRIPFTPEFSASAYGQFNFPVGNLDGLFRATYNHRGDTFSNAANTEDSRTDSTDLFNLRAGVQSEKWWLHLFVDNVGDTNASSFTTTRNGHDWSNRARPRTIGLQFGVSL